VELERNVHALAAKLAGPDPLEISKTNVTKSPDGKTTVTTITVPLTFLTDARHAQARRLAQGGGVVGLYQNSRFGPQWLVLCGLGLVFLGIRDAYRTWRRGGEQRHTKEQPGAAAFPMMGKTQG
jgi:hypothetical protein